MYILNISLDIYKCKLFVKKYYKIRKKNTVFVIFCNIFKIMDIQYMQMAIDAAQLSDVDIPIGAVIVKDNRILAFAHNQKEADNDATAHAELLVIKKASHKIGNWRLEDCDLYVTLEPCPMCMWAILQSRIKNLYFGAYDTVYGAISTIPQMMTLSNSKLNFKGGIMEHECKVLLDSYFKSMRIK